MITVIQNYTPSSVHPSGKICILFLFEIPADVYQLTNLMYYS